MFVYEKRLQYPIKIKNTNPILLHWDIGKRHTGTFSGQTALHNAAGGRIRIGILQGKIPPSCIIGAWCARIPSYAGSKKMCGILSSVQA